MNELDILTQEIIQSLKNELPKEYKGYINEFKYLVDKELLRQSYMLIYDLKCKKNWNPSAKMKGLMDKYIMVF